MNPKESQRNATQKFLRGVLVGMRCTMPKKSDQLSIRFDAETKETLRRIHEKEGVTAPEFVRRMVQAGINHYRATGAIPKAFATPPTASALPVGAQVLQNLTANAPEIVDGIKSLFIQLCGSPEAAAKSITESKVKEAFRQSRRTGTHG